MSRRIRTLRSATVLATLAALTGAGLTAAAHAQCTFDARGLITNTDDPTCRDARFELTADGTAPDQIALGYEPPVPVDSLAGVAGFRTYAALHAQHQALLLTHPSVSGHIVGQTLAGRDVWAYVLGDADRQTPEGFAEPAVMLNGGIHAREWQSPEAVTEVFEQLAETADDGGVGQYLADAVTVIVLPVQNIDGFLQTQAFPTQVSATPRQPRDGRMRRKNLRGLAGGALVDDALATSNDQWYGVDLNRNSVHGFGLNNGSSANPISLVYRGASPASEPETLALQAAAALGPAERLRFYVDAHSFTRQFFVPLTGNARRDAITQALATRLAAATGGRYAVTLDPAGTEIGLTSNYFAQEFQIPSWTLEIEPRAGGQDYGGTGVSHSGFVLPAAEVPRMRDEVATMQRLGFYRQAGPPSVRAVQISRQADAAVVLRADWVADAANQRRTLSVATDVALTAGEDYSLWVAFTKPMRIGDGLGNAGEFPGQTPPPLGAISLDAGPAEADDQLALAGDLTHWLGDAGGAPNGFATYAYDAFRIAFTAPTVAAAATYALSLDVQDLSMLALDADPASPVDWRDGHWSGYQDALGESSDTGGADCQIMVRVAPAGAPATAAQRTTCKAAAPPAPAAPPPAPAPPPAASGSGGGALCPLFLALMLLTRRRHV